VNGESKTKTLLEEKQDAGGIKVVVRSGGREFVVVISSVKNRAGITTVEEERR
jgi:hypothetical protein